MKLAKSAKKIVKIMTYNAYNNLLDINLNRF